MESILRQQTHRPFEIVVIDDGSTDNTSQVLRSFDDPRLRVFTHPENRGHVAAVNEGLSQARGFFIARIDPDDRYRSHFLSATLEKFSACPEVGLVYGDAALINEHGEITAERSDRVHGGKDFKGNELPRLLEENFICSPTVIARREAWLKALPVPDGLAFHDWYFTVTMAREYDFYYTHRVLADYRVHPLNHHNKVVRNKSEEASIFWLLDRVFAIPEKDPGLERRKQRIRGRAYAAQYLTLADKYFGFWMDADARRCYLNALRHRPPLALRAALLRRLIGACIGRKAYERLKGCIPGVPPFAPQR